MIVWFKGISGVGKSTLGNYFYKIKKKKNKKLGVLRWRQLQKTF